MLSMSQLREYETQMFSSVLCLATFLVLYYSSLLEMFNEEINITTDIARRDAWRGNMALKQRY